MYTGSLGIPNAMNYCIEAMNQLIECDIAMVIIGNGSEKKALVEQSKNKNVFFFDSVPKNTIQTVLSFADICIISWLDLEIYEYGISPNKLFDYMFAGKAIIQAVNSPYNIIGESHCGINIKPENIKEIQNAICKLSDLSNDELQLMGAIGKEKVLNEFTYEKLGEKLLYEALN